MTPRQLEILQHALGCDEYGQGAYPKVSPHPDYYPYHRNHFCAGGNDVETCKELVALGYMETFEREYLPYFNCTVTEAGKTAMIKASPKPPKLTRSQLRYRRFLEADSDMSFRDWMRYEQNSRFKSVTT